MFYSECAEYRDGVFADPTAVFAYVHFKAFAVLGLAVFAYKRVAVDPRALSVGGEVMRVSEHKVICAARVGIGCGVCGVILHEQASADESKAVKRAE